MQFIGLLILILLAGFSFYWGLVPIDPTWRLDALPSGDLVWLESAKPFWYAALVLRLSLLYWGIRIWRQGWSGKLLTCAAGVGVLLALGSYPVSPGRVMFTRDALVDERSAPSQGAPTQIRWSEINSVDLERANRTTTEQFRTIRRRRWRTATTTFLHTDIVLRSKSATMALPVVEVEDMGWARILRPNFGFSVSANNQRALIASIEERVPKDTLRGPGWAAARQSQ